MWEPVVESEDHNVNSYDPSSIKQDGDMVTFWEMIDYKTPIKYGEF
ncbi:surface-adhesin E family protein [Polynucleobacter sphagniphilus]